MSLRSLGAESSQAHSLAALHELRFGHLADARAIGGLVGIVLESHDDLI